jgi:tripartite-type tricarboxylate transporter receptor subunit TctC
MKLPRRTFLHLAAGAAALPLGLQIAWAQAYPSRPVRIIVGFAAGGGADIVARLMGQWLSGRLGQQFVVENRVGAGTNIATEAVARAAPDGYTLLLVNPANAINATLYDKLNFDFIRDIAPVAGIIRLPLVMVVNASFPAKTIVEFIAYAKANPGKINMASAGIGATSHIAGENVQGDGQRQYGSRTISRGRARGHRSVRRSGAGILRRPSGPRMSGPAICVRWQ